MQPRTVETAERPRGVAIETTRAYALRTGVLVGLIVAAILVTANLWAARPGAAVSTVGDAADTTVPPAEQARSGGLALYPLLY